jgi:hypothetical protein
LDWNDLVDNNELKLDKEIESNYANLKQLIKDCLNEGTVDQW